MMKKKTAIITGGTSGIGLATATTFLKNGYSVIVCSVDRKDVVEKAMDQLSILGEVTYYPLDISKEEQCKDIIDRVVKDHHRIDILLNIAGTGGKLTHFLNADLVNTKMTIDVNLMGTIYMSAYASTYMKKQNSGGYR